MKPKVIKNLNVEIDVPVAQLANFFWMISPEDKVEYFNELAKQTEDWFDEGFKGCEAEIAAFINSPELSERAKHILKLLSQ